MYVGYVDEAVVDSVYDDDPKLNTNDKKLDEIHYSDIIHKGLKVMDA
jgi:uridylate kinase